MMPVMRIPDATFSRLKAIAIPFDDTPASVIGRLLDLYEDHEAAKAGLSSRSIKPSQPQPRPSEATRGTQFSPDSPPDLGHTRVISASFAGRPAENWNDLVVVAHRAAIKQLKSVDAVRTATLSNIATGRREDRGFHHYSDGNFSIQNVDANLAWRNAVHLARHLKVPLDVTFQWRHKQGASHPGVTAVLSWRPE